MPARRTVWRYRIATTLVIGTVIALGSSGTVAAAIQSSSAQPRPRHNNFLLVNPGVRELQVTLEGLRGKNLLVTEPGGYLNGWVTYFGRYNQIWLGSANINGVNLADVPTASSLFDLSQLPDDTLILSNTANSRSMIPEGATVVWSGIAYTLWTPGTSNWAIILEVVNKNGIERSNGKDFFWMNTDDTIVRVLSSKTGVLQITAAFMLGPSVSGSAGRSLAISNTSGDHHQLIVGNEERTVAVPVQKGGNEIVFHAFDQPNVSALPNGEPRTLVLGVRGLWVTLAK